MNYTRKALGSKMKKNNFYNLIICAILFIEIIEVIFISLLKLENYSEAFKYYVTVSIVFFQTAFVLMYFYLKIRF